MNHEHLLPCLLRLSQVQAQAVDRLALQACLTSALQSGDTEPRRVLTGLLERMQWPAARWFTGDELTRIQVPALALDPVHGWSVLRGRTPRGEWITESLDASTGRWVETARTEVGHLQFAQVPMTQRMSLGRSPVFKLIKDALLYRRSLLLEIALAGMMINLVAIATSLYSMQVYDRVVPTGATQTLLALTLGVLGTVVFELLTKFVKSALSERLADEVDSHLARLVYTRFLAVRMDQLPASVGSLSGQLKGYETVRAFISSVPAQLLIDLPFLLIYCATIGFIGGWIGLIPVGFMVLSLGLGLAYRRRVESLTRQSSRASHLKTGLLVETIEGAETIKSGQGGWRMLSRWLQTTDEARATEFQMRQVTEHAQYWIAALHQVSYIAMVAFGALIVVQAGMTVGALIACTILSGRILAPIGAFPGMLIQWGHCSAALHGLDRVWALQDDHHGIEQPVVLEGLEGHYRIEGVEASYSGKPALKIQSLQIRPGEKIAVLGPVGAGKTTLLRLLSGMYKPQAGRIELDGVDLAYISKPVLAEQIGFLQQEGRLFAGTLRDNLVLGLVDPGDPALLEAAKLTGLHGAVLADTPMGLQQPISEGGLGLSGGQKQLTNLTRVFLRKPRIWLLDEPTASLDRQLEATVVQALSRTLRPEDTLVLVTHKPEMLSLVQRIIVVAQHQIVVDGPRDEVLRTIQHSAAMRAGGHRTAPAASEAA